MNDIEHVLRIVSSAFPKQNISCLLIGGYAVNHYGYTRSTLDVDFMCGASDIVKIRTLMMAEGFTNTPEQENVAFFQKPESALRVDFLKVDLQTIERLLSRAEKVEFNKQELLVPALMDLIAMKLFAAHNGARPRMDKDLPDIVHLMIENDVNVDRDLRPLCIKYADGSLYSEICKRIEDYRK